MPVRFACPSCHHMLRVTRRKIGSDVACPCCTASLTVPDKAQGEASVVELHMKRRAEKTSSKGSGRKSLRGPKFPQYEEVFNFFPEEEPRRRPKSQPAKSTPILRAEEVKREPRSAAPEELPKALPPIRPASSRLRSQPPKPPALLFNAVMLLATACAAAYGGYVWGRSEAHADAASPAAKAPVAAAAAK